MLYSKAIWALLLVVTYVAGQTGSPAARLTDIAGYPLEFLRAPQPGTPLPQNSWEPTSVPLRPLSMRIMYRPITQVVTNGITYGGTSEEDLLHQLVIVAGDGLTSTFPLPTIRLKLIDPTVRDCRLPSPLADFAEFGPANFGTAPGNSQLLSRGTTLAYFQIPTLGEQTPHEHLMPWICICASTSAPDCADTTGSAWIHTNMRLATVQGCLGDNLELAAASAINTATAPTTIVTGYTPFLCQYNIVNTVRGTLLGNFPIPNAQWGEADYDGQVSATTPVIPPTPTNPLYIERRLRTKCCGWRDSGLADPNNLLTNGNGIVMTRRFGVCINPILESCCNRYESGQGVQRALTGSIGGMGKPYSRFREKCCFGGIFNALNQIGSIAASSANPGSAVLQPQAVFTSYLDDWCPCKAGTVNNYCNQQVPYTDPTYACCVNSKYPEIASVPSGVEPLWGKCFNQLVMKCCNTGDLYDPGSKQCCSINGVQSINVPCPCALDSHCGVNQTCCQDITRPSFPTPNENLNLCNKYVNYPSGTGPYSVQPCIGQCIDTRFQICCNGMACIDMYEVCCNSTCCNKFSQRCTMGLRSGALGQPGNRKDFRVPYEVCTEMEGMTPFRAILAYLLPLFLLAATFTSLFATLNFAKRQSSLQPLSVYEKSMFVFATISILLSWPLFFSTMYKYGIVWIWAMFFVMLASLSQLRALNIAAIIILGITLIYVIDPFYGNEILTLASGRIPPPMAGVYGWSGVLGSIVMNAIGDYSYCTTWYDYFRRDPLVQDMRYENPTGDLTDLSVSVSHHTYGFCSRGWFVTLAVLEGINIIITYFLFFLTLITHIRNILFEKAQKTDDVVRQPWY